MKRQARPAKRTFDVPLLLVPSKSDIRGPKPRHMPWFLFEREAIIVK